MLLKEQVFAELCWKSYPLKDGNPNSIGKITIQVESSITPHNAILQMDQLKISTLLFIHLFMFLFHHTPVVVFVCACVCVCVCV